MNKNNEIDRNIIEIAKNAASRINGSSERKRAFALSAGAMAFAKVLLSDGFNVSFKHSLFKIPAFAQNFELADIYANNARIDVRVTFDDKNFYIPKAHKKYDASPDLYVVLKMEKDLSQMSIEGFVFPKEIEDAESVDEYYVIPLKKLNSMKGFKKALESIKPADLNCAAGDHQKIAELALAFLDGEISESEKIFFIKHIVCCPLCRERICEFNEFDIITEQAKKYPELLDDSTLDILTGKTLAAAEEEIQNEYENEEQKILETDISDSVFEMVKDAAALDAEPEIIPEAAPDIIASEIEVNEENDNENQAENNENDFDTNSDEIDDLSLFAETQENDAGNIEELSDTSDDELIASDNTESDSLVEFEDNSADEAEESAIELLDDADEELLDENELIETFSDELPDETLAVEPLENEETELDTLESIEEQEDSPVPDNEKDSLDLTEESAEEIVTETENPETEIEFETGIEALQTTEDEEMIENTDDEPMELEAHDELEIEDLELLDEHDDMLLEEPEEQPDTDEPAETIQDETVSQITEEVPENEEKTNEESDMTQEDEPESIGSEETMESAEELNFAEENFEIPEFNDISEPENIESDFENENETISDNEDATSNEELEDFKELLVDEKNIEENTDEIIEVTDENSTTPEYSGIELIDEDNELAEETEDAQAPEVDADSEIQGLLDDELMQLLSSDADSEESTEPDSTHESDFDLISDSDETEVENNEENSINALYENSDEPQEGENPENVELDFSPEQNQTKNSGLAKKLISAAVILFLITTGSITALYLNNNKQTNDAEALPDMNSASQDGSPLDVAANLPQNKDENAAPMAQDLNKSITNVFSDQPAAITITKISWEVSQSLASDDSFRNYLQVAGKNLQLNLQNDLALTTEINYSPKVKVSFEIAKDNSIKRIQVTESSGSEQIDNVVLQSIKETLKYVNAPNIKDYKGNYNLSVVVNF